MPRGYAGDTFEAGETNFRDTSSADAATITNHGKTIALGVTGGIAQFLNDSKAGTATIINEGSALRQARIPPVAGRHSSTGRVPSRR